MTSARFSTVHDHIFCEEEGKQFRKQNSICLTDIDPAARMRLLAAIYSFHWQSIDQCGQKQRRGQLYRAERSHGLQVQTFPLQVVLLFHLWLGWSLGELTNEHHKILEVSRELGESGTGNFPISKTQTAVRRAIHRSMPMGATRYKDTRDGQPVQAWPFCRPKIQVISPCSPRLRDIFPFFP